MLVMKFGGTSVGSSTSLQQVAAIVGEQRDRQPLVVTSAMSGVTDTLLRLASSAESGDRDGCVAIMAELGAHHLQAAYAVAPDGDWEPLRRHLRGLEETTFEVLAGLEPQSAPARDRIVAYGELLAVLLLCRALEAHGVPARSCLEPLIVVEDDVDGSAATPDMGQTRAAVETWMRQGEQPLAVPVVPGFICRSRDGRISNLGRGGSDYSATLLAAALQSEACWIYTDVDGILTADPRIVPEARVLHRISPATAGRLSYSGAQVLHPRSVSPASRAGIELRVRNTFAPHRAGTLIADDPGEATSLSTRPLVVAGRHNLCLVGLAGDGLVEIGHLVGRFAHALSRAEVEIILAPHPALGHDPRVIVDGNDAAVARAALDHEFARERQRGLIGKTLVEDAWGLCSVIGDSLDNPAIVARAQAALSKGAVSWTYQLASAESLCFVVPNSMVEIAVRQMHADLIAPDCEWASESTPSTPGARIAHQGVAGTREQCHQHGRHQDDVCDVCDIRH